MISPIVVLFLVTSAVCETFDYVIVGAGTSGIPLAVRLAQYHTVALIEAGIRYEINNIMLRTPGADVLSIGSDPDMKPGADWGFVTTPQLGANGRRMHFARGKCLGGSSALNFMIYQRQSLDMWAEAVDDKTYTFDNLLPYYQRSTGFTPPTEGERFANATPLFNVSAFDPAGGPLQVSYSNYAMPFSTWMELGMQAIGLPKALDFNSGEIHGYQYCTSTIRASDQSRSSSESSFLTRPIPNLHIYEETLAKRIVFDEQKNAIGVQIKMDGTERTLTASREVIIAAGVFQSPQLLMVSGIGPRKQLQEYNITVLADLPGVGQNMLDHPFFGPSYRVNVETMTRVATNPAYLVAQYIRWFTTHDGILANPVADFLAWENIPGDLRAGFSPGTIQNLSRFPKDWPEAEYISGAGFLGNVSNLFTEQPKDGYEYASMLGVLIATTSLGSVTLVSTDTSDLPIINPNWLTTESDQELAVAMFKRMRQAFASHQMAPIIIGPEYYPGEAVQTDEQILHWIRDNIMTLWHPSSTCKMGTVDDPMAVVDSRARVFGVNRLRVVDASAFPFLPPAHPQATCYMLAEKIAEDILNSAAMRNQVLRMDLRR
ncbi:hypothetical protein BDW59DRAFT_160873 [Aspergillus cavernicola]|uniref:GMC oxidoreductase n=1 Tax=Aspergillus cavernicola TaxID=176166 RepID=A0ABR4IFZ0_9EURO